MAAKELTPILISSPYPFTDTPDGVKDVILSLKPYLEKDGFEINLVGPRIPYIPFIQKKVKNNADNFLGYAFTIPINNTRAKYPITFGKQGAMEILSRVKPRLVIVHEPFAGTLTHTLITAALNLDQPRPKFIGHFHAQTEQLDKKTRFYQLISKVFKRPEVRRFGKFTPGTTNTVNNNLVGRIAVSQATAKFWNKLFPANYQVIYNGIDTDQLTPPSFDKLNQFIDEWVKERKKIVLFTGRHDQRKGIDDLIVAFALVRSRRADVSLKIIGQGAITNLLKKQVINLNLPDVSFIDPLPRQILIKAYRTAAYYGLTISTPTGGEGSGLVLPEAMACGSLVIGTDIPGYNEVLKPYPFSKMVKPKNPHSIALAINQVLSLPLPIKVKLAFEARKYVVKNFSLRKAALENSKYFRAVLRI